jgi:tRNA-(ms[2]io[6]A)-hydroxylase
MILPEIHEFLGCRTPDGWVQAALADQETLLIDHKNCEFKAASTALSLIAKYHSHVDLINMMSRLAREELVHHEQVMRLMKRRKIELRQLSAGRYASGLRKVVRSHEPSKPAVASVSRRWCRIWTKSWASSISACSKAKRDTFRGT